MDYEEFYPLSDATEQAKKVDSLLKLAAAAESTEDEEIFQKLYEAMECVLETLEPPPAKVIPFPVKGKPEEEPNV